MLKTIPLFIFLLLTFSKPSFTQDPSQPEDLEAKIKAMEQEIQEYKELLQGTKGQHSDLENDLEKTGKNVNELKQKVDAIETELKQGEDKISTLKSQQKELHAKKTEQQAYIEKQIQAAYKIGKQEYLKVVLNQEDPNEMSRMLTYYDYLNRARAQEVNKFRGTLTQLSEVAESIELTNLQLAGNRKELDRQYEALKLEKDKKEKLLVTLNQRIATTGGELTKLTKDRNRLEQLLKRIHDADIPIADNSAPFKGMKGELLLPVSGTISQSFGTNRKIGKMRWRGIFIEAPEGEPVRAIHYGRVVFSDWLRGFGLLLIVNHGEGYMSLYGHNQTITRETGDWVTAGETIATVGDTGGQNNTGLYFEIRIDGAPSDPQLWCQVRDRRAA
ncbi:MAG: peptidoglycan DD-metalloendopeptidase family protein [Pseudomonadales bacterium]|nr:peptidoglycan DD-metalloendopeptidase family protein [Pseudomonadales bacterium]